VALLIAKYSKMLSGGERLTDFADSACAGFKVIRLIFIFSFIFIFFIFYYNIHLSMRGL
jgi:hypothetical protein